REAGLAVLGSSSASLRDVLVLETTPNARGEYGTGIEVTEYSELFATDCVLQGNHDKALTMGDSVAVLERVQVLDTQSGADGASGHGIRLLDSTMEATGCLVRGNQEDGVLSIGSTATIRDSALEENRETGLALYEESEVTLEDVKILDTQPNQDGDYGRGINVEGGGTLVATDCVLEGNHELGLFVESSTATLQGVQILDTRPDANGTRGHGIAAQIESTLVATDCVVEGSHEYGILVESSTATLQGVDILDTHPNQDGELGHGLSVYGGDLVATDCVVEGNSEYGVFVYRSTAVLDGSQVLDTQTTGRRSAGIAIEGETTLQATDTLVQGNHIAGITVDDSTALLDDVQVLDTRRGTQVSSAVGVVSQVGATLIATGLAVHGNDGPGMYSVLGASLDCTGCTLSDNRFAAASVQAGGTLTLRDTLVEGTMEAVTTGGGVGVFASDAGLHDDYGLIAPGPQDCSPRVDCVEKQVGPPTLSVQDSIIRDNQLGAIYIKGAGTYQITGNDLDGGAGLTATTGRWSHGDAVFARVGEEVPAGWNDEEGTGLLLEENTFSGCSGAGVFLDGVSATLSANTYQDNTTDLVWQACDQVDTPSGLDDEPLATMNVCPEYDYATQQLELNLYLTESEAEY
ncbi:MAG: right-handed parallel beta-helix repeat-containing protein, partial [Myxococcota bacterium]|nr:right-handed parallel beta-helix repeat-containing protein [Myxococcota bacterium]